MNEKLDKACQYLIAKSFSAYDPKTCGHCALAVRNAFDFGFGVHIEQTEAAKNYAPSYEKIGFKKIFSYPAQKKEEYKPQIGDISIIQPVVVKGVIQHPNGHICVKTEKGWISDFMQGSGGSKLILADMYGGPIRDCDPAFDIYRY